MDFGDDKELIVSCTVNHFLASRGSSRIVAKPALRNPFLMLHKVTILLQPLFQPCLLPVQGIIEENMCISKDARIEQSRRFLAKEKLIVSQ